MKIEQINLFKDWLKIKEIKDNGLIINDKKEFITILKIDPINYNLKSELEKEIILENYKNIFFNLETEIQIFIQSKKINLEENIKYIKENNNSELLEKYIKYLEKLNNNKKTANKEYYVIIKNKNEDYLKEIETKIKNQLNKCKNKSEKINKEKIQELINSILILGGINDCNKQI